MVLAWLHRSISESIAKSVLWIDNAAAVWMNLRIRYSQSDIFRISDIQEDLYKFPAREQDYVIRFLKGLNKIFLHSKSQIMMMNPLPDIDRAFSLVIQQERELNSSVTSLVSSTDSSQLAMAMQVSSQQGNFSGKNGYKGKGQGSNSAKGNKLCTHCSRTNHIVESCFVKHGYPPGYRGKGKYQQNFGSQANSTVNEASGSTASSFGFTQEQYNNIMEFLQQSKANSQPQANSVTTSPFVLNSHSSSTSGKHSNLWILDTGATDHISFNLPSFTNCKNIVPIPVSLPNGSQIFASISGSIVISPSLTLHNVLYIPTFHVNLISVPKLASDNDCHLHFNANTCQILHNHSKEMIGTTNLQRGLYVLDSTILPSICNYVGNNPPDLWHLRLGHISDVEKATFSK
ncbi:retrovirus-related pol polyprotein from transposon TNT 1-94 [Trifolium medium]|uniref:Retrovirus-related pol polyprotein from transposon TNT 1-94 n=1 Tax=Trifolium medium TaxID=97028 RepID=A0A392M7H3_9FABA|nr:retrovirus-related pol polyprotein from transposon TNT 1-94 [Trifolium medium]